MLAMALVSEAVTDWVGDSGLVRQISARFTGPYRLGDVLTVSGEVVACRDGLADLRLRCVNQEGTEIVGRASATVWAEERSSDDD
jgi:acyl dehydratase